MSNPPLRSSSGAPIPCITPSTETNVVVVSFMAAIPFSLLWSSFGRLKKRISMSESRRSARLDENGHRSVEGFARATNTCGVL